MISNEEFPLLIQRFFKRIPDSGLTTIGRVKRNSLIVDNVYSLVEKNVLFSVIRGNPLLQYPNQLIGEEILDCDDFAMHLKSSVTSLQRQNVLTTGVRSYPPAVGIVITQNHALNIVVTKWGENKKRVFLIDTMKKSPELVSNKEKCAVLLKILPVKFIYI